MPAAAPSVPGGGPRRDDGLLQLLDAEAIDSAAAQLFLRAARSARSGQYAVAESSYSELARRSPALADWAHVLAADAAARAGDATATVAHLQAGNSWLAREWGWRARLHVKQREGNPSDAAALTMSTAAELQLPGSRTQARKLAAELWLVAGDSNAARAALLLSISDSAGPTGAAPAALLLSRVSRSGTDVLAAARILLAAGNAQAASDLLPRLLTARSLAGRERAQFRLDLARAHFEARRYTRAEAVATALVADGQEPSDLRADARVVHARALLRRGQRDAAAVQLERALASGMPRAAADAAFVLADLAHDQYGFDAASPLYLKSAWSAPVSASAGEALIRLGAAAYARSQFDSAQHWFEQARTGPASLQARATYWSARARTARADTSALPLMRQLAQQEPVSLYGLRAQDQLSLGPLVSLSEGPSRSSSAERRMQRAFQRWDLLRQAELTELASFELERLRRALADAPELLYALAEQMHGAGQTQRAVALGRELRNTLGGWDQRLLRIVYPLPFQDLIERAARQQGVDPYLAAALIRQESAFNPRATSVAGARGLMQIMPRTGRTLAAQARKPRFQTARLYDPAFNLELGMMHLKALLDEYGGRLPLVLSAYNAGAHRLVHWQNFPESMDDELFSERIPFSETRDYVRIVQQNARIYRALYGQASPAAGALPPQH